MLECIENIVKIGRIKIVKDLKREKSLQPRSIHRCLPVTSVMGVLLMVAMLTPTWVATTRPSPSNKVTSTPSTITIT